MIILEGLTSCSCDILTHGNLIPYFLRLDFRKNRIADYTRLYMGPGQLRLCSRTYNQIQLKLLCTPCNTQADLESNQALQSGWKPRQ